MSTALAADKDRKALSLLLDKTPVNLSPFYGSLSKANVGKRLKARRTQIGKWRYHDHPGSSGLRSRR